MKRKIFSFIALMPIIFAYLILFISPAFSSVNYGLNWYAKIDYLDTTSTPINFNPTDYSYCGISPEINYNWGGDATSCTPENPDFFTNLWTGYITAPESGMYTFYSSNDDGFILKINGQTVIDSWWEQGSWWFNGQGSFEMVAGESYTIEILHHETGGGAVAQLFWTVPSSQEIVIVPNTVLTTDPVEPQAYLNKPTNLNIVERNEYITLSWDAPEDSGTSVERYAVMWSVNGSGWGIASTETSIRIDKDVLESTAALNQNFTFYVRSDNDSLGIYSEYSEPLTKYIDYPQYTCWDDSIVRDPSDCPVEPPVEPTEPPVEPTEPPVEPTEPPVDPEPTDEPTIEPKPTEEPTKPSEPTLEPTAPEDTPSPSNTPDFEPKPTPVPDTIDEKVEELLDSLNGAAVTSEMIAKLGIDYEDLPPDTPVQLDNGVILTAEVADALEMFENPTEILGAVFTDPGKALTAFANVGSDMTPEKREESQKVVVAAVIAGQILSTTSMVGRIR